MTQTVECFAWVEVNITALTNLSREMNSRIHFVWNKKTFRVSIAQWCICTTSDRWFTREESDVHRLR